MKFSSFARLIAACAAAVFVLPFAACAAESGNGAVQPPAYIPDTPEVPDINPPDTVPPPDEPEPERPRDIMIMATVDGLNVRSGAGSGYKSLGSLDKGDLIRATGLSDGWYKVEYKKTTAYVSSSASFTERIEMERSDSEKIEKVLDKGMTLYGVPYELGAQRLHWGNGVRNTDFTGKTFDCSSFTQYAYYYGADILLGTTTRDQVRQGAPVTYSNLKRGDLMFFTNDARVNKTGLERVGHVAIYIGDQYILHTASDYAVIEKISAKRKGYFIEGRRFL